MERNASVTGRFVLDGPATGRAVLVLTWTDALGRTVEHRQVLAGLHEAGTIDFALDPLRAATMANTLRASVTIDGRPAGEGRLDFIVRPPVAPWDDWLAFMWQSQSVAEYQTLQRGGVANGMVAAIRGAPDPAEMSRRVTPLLQAGSRWYVENIATDFYSAYHRWTPEHPSDVAFRFTEAKQLYRATPPDPVALQRVPSLSDPVWLAEVTTRVHDIVAGQAAYRPRFYNLGDEAGIADLSANWDFDFSPVALASFRVWLRGRYDTLEALNRQWSRDFATWEDVLPATTDQALAASDDNFSAWSDFKDWMDLAFARAVRAGTDAVHSADPAALSAIEGAQVPGWGGYDYARLAGAVDVMEVYDAGANVEIAHSLNPSLAVLTTSFRGGKAEVWRIWHEALLGGRGLVIWDSHKDFATRGVQPTLTALTGGIGAQLIAAAPVRDDVAILYSPASQRVHWLLDRRAERGDWTKRDAEAEFEDRSPTRLARERAVRVLSHLGLQPRFVSSAMLEQGVLRRFGLRVIILPEAIALSSAEAAALISFRASGGVIVADGQAGLFDGHGRRLTTPQIPPPPPFDATTLAPGMRLSGPASGQVDLRRLQTGGVTVLALQRDPSATASSLTIDLPQPAFVTDLLRPGPARWLGSVPVLLDEAVPTLLAISPTQLPAPSVLVGWAGAVATLQIALDGRSPAAAQALRIEVIDPAGKGVAAYSGVAVMRAGEAAWAVPFADSDAPGTWAVRVTDVLGTAEHHRPIGKAARLGARLLAIEAEPPSPAGR